MSTRLQIVMDDEEAERYRRAAAREQLTLSEWVRRSLRRSERARRGPTPEATLQVLERALECGHPTADLDEMLQEIENGRGLR